MLDRVKSNKKIRIITNRVIRKWVGDKGTQSLAGAEISPPGVSETPLEVLPCQAGFIAIGHKPNTKFLKNQVHIDFIN